MYKTILAAVLLASSLGALCPAPANATSTPQTESRHRRRRRRHRGPRRPRIELGTAGNSTKAPWLAAGTCNGGAFL